MISQILNWVLKKRDKKKTQSTEAVPEANFRKSKEKKSFQ